MREWLLEFRKKERLTQEEVAKKAGIARSYYTKIEGGLYEVPVKTAAKIAVVLNFDWSFFYEDKSA